MEQFGRSHHDEYGCQIILILDQWFRRKCWFEKISYLELWQAICPAEQNHLCNFDGGYYEEQCFL